MPINFHCQTMKNPTVNWIQTQGAPSGTGSVSARRSTPPPSSSRSPGRGDTWNTWEHMDYENPYNGIIIILLDYENPYNCWIMNIYILFGIVFMNYN